MAAGDALLELRAPFGFPIPDCGLAAIPGGSTPGETFFAYVFDASTTEYVDFRVTIPGHYGGGGLALECQIHMASATTNSVRVEAAVRYLDPSESMVTSHTYSFQGVTITVPGTLNRKASGTIVFTSAQADSIVAKGEAIIRVRRKTDHAGDTASGDMYLAVIYVREKSAAE